MAKALLKALDSRDAIDLSALWRPKEARPAASVRVDGRTPREWSRHAVGPPKDPVAT